MAEVEWMYQMYSTNNEYMIPNQFDAPFNVVKIILWTLPKYASRPFMYCRGIVSGSASQMMLEERKKTLQDPDPQVEAIVERCRDIVIGDDEEEWGDIGKTVDVAEAVGGKVMLVGEKLAKLEGLLSDHLQKQTENFESIRNGRKKLAVPEAIQASVQSHKPPRGQFMSTGTGLTPQRMGS